MSLASSTETVATPRMSEPVAVDRKALFWAALVLLSGLTLTAFVNSSMRANHAAIFHERFEQSARQFVDHLQDKLAHYGPGISAIRALFKGADVHRISLQTFHNFASEINLGEDFPAATGIGYAAVVPPQKRANFEQEVRRLGRPDFRIPKLDAGAETGLLVQYLEPEFDHMQDIGTDLARTPQLRDAAWRAIERNLPVLSRIQPVDRAAKPGAWFTLFLPVYQTQTVLATAAQRRQAAQGVVFLPLNLQTLLDELLLIAPDLHIRLSDVAQDRVFFGSDDVRASSQEAQPFEADLNVYGAQWRVSIRADQSLEKLLSPHDIAVNTTVLLLSSVLAAVALYLLLANLERRRQAAWANARLAAIVESVDEAIVGQDLAGHITSWNQAAQSLFGHSAAQALGQDFHALVPSDLSRQADDRLLALAQQGHSVPSVSWTLQQPDAPPRTILMGLSAVQDEAGTPIGYARIMRDISVQQQLEAELREAHKMQAVGQLTGGLAHDFNNLLGVVLGNLENLQAELPNRLDAAQQSLHAAQSAALRGADVARSLLSLARRQSPQTSLHELNQELQSLLPLLQSSAGSELKVRTQLMGGPTPVQIEPGGLSNAVLNLVINARDACRGLARENTVTLSTHLVSPERSQQIKDLSEGYHIELRVRDNGPGMPEDVVQRAFEPLFTTKAFGQGTGLGLAMVLNFAKQMGGTASIDSSPDQGTTVSLWLPLDAQAFAAQQATEQERLQALHDLNLLDTPPDPRLDALTRAAAHLCDAPIALISLIDEQRQWFKSRYGLAVQETHRDLAFCAHAIQGDAPMVVEDASADPRFSGNALVLNEPHIRYYCGVPIADAQGHKLGTLCVIDRKPRTLSPAHLAQLQQLAVQARRVIDPGSRAQPIPASATGPQDPWTPPVQHSGARVLVVDDEPELLRLACDWLQDMGFEVVPCHSAQEALQQLGQRAYHLLFTDIILPGHIDGVALAHQALAQNPQMRVLFTSGYTGVHAGGPALPGPLLSKPYRRKALLQAVLDLGLQP